MFPMICTGPGPHDPTDGVLGTADSPGVGGLCPLCFALTSDSSGRPPLESEIAPLGSPRDLTAVRERTV